VKIRSTIMTLAALATLSVSALAPTKASAWSMGGGYSRSFGGGYHFGGVGGSRFGGFGGYRSMGYFRPSYGPQISASAPTYRRYVTYSSPAYAPPTAAYAPAPVVTYQQPYAPQPAYVAAPTEAPCSPCPSEGSEPQAYTPAPQAYAPAPQGYAPAPQQVQMPQAPQYQAPVQQPAQDRYSSTELQK
jgi:hypothetical protein